MIISRTPYRISLFGGGTDYPQWYLQHGGSVLSTTIDKYCYISLRNLPPFFDHKFRVVYSKIESANRINDIKHPSVRETLKYLGYHRGIEIHHDGDLPARSGMGSSSAFTVGLLNGLYALNGTMVSKKKLMYQSIEIEQNRLNENVGSQDQANAAYGGFNYIKFNTTSEIDVSPIIIPSARYDELNSNLFLYYTGLKRTADKVAAEFLSTYNEKKTQLRILTNLVDESISILNSNKSIDHIGELMNESWYIKKSLGDNISNSYVNKIYDDAIKAGAVGGKITGAGGGGFMLFYVPPENHTKVREKLNQLVHVPFNFENKGSQVIFYDEEIDYSMAEKDNYARNIKDFKELDKVLGKKDHELNYAS